MVRDVEYGCEGRGLKSIRWSEASPCDHLETSSLPCFLWLLTHVNVALICLSWLNKQTHSRWPFWAAAPFISHVISEFDCGDLF